MKSSSLMRWVVASLMVVALASPVLADEFAPVSKLISQHCVRCHQGDSAKGGLNLSTSAGMRKGGENGPAIAPGKPDESLLLDYVMGDKPLMPKAGPPLSKSEIATLRRWIEAGAAWPEAVVLKEERGPWWSLMPLKKPNVPETTRSHRVRNSIDAFLLAKLQSAGLTFSPDADRRTQIRRLTFDLTGLPPTPEEVAAFVSDADPKAYEKLVDRLLDSPRYGERWARHWLDVVHYGDTHGYDKDKRRPNAWPYRDYVIRSLNDDKPYSRFAQEQLAGDVLFPEAPEGVVATGFIAAGPWDFVGQVELREGTVDKQITRNLDRDDMVTNAIGTFLSQTVHCARCHDHKFDPISQSDYYALQAVFAGVDRAERPYETDPETAKKRWDLAKEKAALETEWAALEKQVAERAGPELATLNRQLAELTSRTKGTPRPEFGYHSQIAAKPDVEKWVQVDLGKPTEIAELVLVGCHDTFNNIGAGFGFPVRYRVDVSDDPAMKQGVTTVVDKSAADVPNPGIVPQAVPLKGVAARYVRVTATRLAPRKDDYIFALAELAALTGDKKNAAAGVVVSSLDSIEAGPRWSKKNLVDGISYQSDSPELVAEIARLGAERDRSLRNAVTDDLRSARARVQTSLQRNSREIAALPAAGRVYAAATDFSPVGAFRPTSGAPRAIHLLHRGEVTSPREEAMPGALACVEGLPARFELSDPTNEGSRRAALARWITDPKNPLTWRSIVNRVWHYHFGRGIVETPNDFGRMGQAPTHPDLLDWLAVEFRDKGQSLKSLHRLIVTSTAYRQASSRASEAEGAASGETIDAGNRLLWRMNRRRLDAEEIRDAALFVGGTLNLTMYGPGFDLFGFQDDHSPRYKYEEHDPDDPRSQRRTIYRFVVRSVPDPLMETFDCADPSLITPVRQTTMTPLQALALLNNKLMIRQAERLAQRAMTLAEVEKNREPSTAIATAFQLSLGREPTEEERALLTHYAKSHGLPNACRVILNMNEFVFVD